MSLNTLHELTYMIEVRTCIIDEHINFCERDGLESKENRIKHYKEELKRLIELYLFYTDDVSKELTMQNREKMIKGFEKMLKRLKSLPHPTGDYLLSRVIDSQKSKKKRSKK